MIEITDHQPQWATIAADWARRLGNEFTSERVMAKAIGAASTPGLAGRPEVDLLVTVPNPAEASHMISSLYAQRFIVEPAWNDETPPWLVRDLEKELSAHRIRLLICLQGSKAALDALAISEQLSSQPLVASAFGDLKRKVASDCGGDVSKYDAGKRQFFSEILNAARGSCDQPK